MVGARVEVAIGPLPTRARMLLPIAAVLLSILAMLAGTIATWNDVGPRELRCVGADPNTTCTIWRNGAPITGPLDASKERVGNSAAKTPRSCTILDGEPVCAISHHDMDRLRALGVGQVAVVPLDQGSSGSERLLGALVWAIAVGGICAHYVVTLRRSRRRTVTLGVTADRIEVTSVAPVRTVRRSSHDDVVVVSVASVFSYPSRSLTYGSVSPIELARFRSSDSAELEPYAARLRDALAATKGKG